MPIKLELEIVDYNGEKCVKEKCKCGCHIRGGMHFTACCDNGYVYTPVRNYFANWLVQ